MINISDFKQLGIILPNTNKALAQVLTESTHKELETITQGKDLKTVLGNLLKQSGETPESNKELLQLVKNNPTLKNLGDVTTTIKDLLTALKTDKNPLPIEKTLQTFLSDVKDLKNSEIKQKLENSGVFLESKIKNVKNPQLELKNTLTSLAKNLQESNSPTSRVVANEAKVILSTEVLKSVKAPLVQAGQTSTASTTSATLSPTSPSQTAQVPVTPSPQKQGSNLENILTTKENPKALEQLSSKVQTLITKLQSTLSKADAIHSPVLSQVMEKLEHKLEPKVLTPENFKFTPIKESLEQVSSIVSKSFTMESKSLLGSLEKIFLALKTVDQTATTPKVSLESFLDKKIPQQIIQFSEDIKNVIQKAEPIFHKDTQTLLNKLETLNTPQKLHPQSNVKELISTDLKAVLLQAGEEIVKANHPNQAEVTKQIDKLSLQIDNYQLLSHLSNGTSLYLPFSWDMMEDGNIQMKKSDDDKFYCDIDLKLKEYGELNLKLTLFEENQLNLHIYSSNEEFKEIVKQNIPSLRSALIDTQITPREIRIFEPKAKQQNSPYGAVEDELQIGFEVKA